MKNVQVYNYYDTWLKGFDNKIENLILSHLLECKIHDEHSS